MWLMIYRTHVGKCWRRLWTSHPLFVGWGSFGFNLMTDISYGQQTPGKEACQTPDSEWSLTLTSLGQLAPVYLGWVLGLWIGKCAPYSPAKDTAVSSHSAMGCLFPWCYLDKIVKNWQPLSSGTFRKNSMVLLFNACPHHWFQSVGTRDLKARLMEVGWQAYGFLFSWFVTHTYIQIDR